MPAKINLLGQKIGRLTVLEPVDNIKGRTAWKCQCDCGNIINVTTKSLRSGNTKSCGCLQKEIIRKKMSKDISQQRFGSLIAIEPTEERKHGSVMWKCQCDCGNIHYTTAEILLSGHCQSCGCIRSRGNSKIKRILQLNNIPFIAEYSIRINDVNYYYDFAILKDEKIYCFIEYDGILHFKQDEYHGWNNKENWEKTKANDCIKNKYALEKNIPLIRIPYWDFEKINFDYLQRKVKECIADTLLH